MVNTGHFEMLSSGTAIVYRCTLYREVIPRHPGDDHR
jgi:hypothetical protein